MVKLLEDNQVDLEQERIDLEVSAAEEEIAHTPMRKWQDGEVAPDLSDGGTINGVHLTPRHDGKIMERGRPAARRAWSWNGTETTLPLAWNPDGNQHDNARRYLTKKHCLCCNAGGFRTRSCPSCVKNNCDKCHRSSDPKKIIPNFYLRKEDVPFPEKFYGDVNCFLTLCIRRDSKGFKTEQDMRIHARTRHKMEYAAYLEGQQASRSDEVAILREQLNILLADKVKEKTPVAATAQTARVAPRR